MNRHKLYVWFLKTLLIVTALSAIYGVVKLFKYLHYVQSNTICSQSAWDSAKETRDLTAAGIVYKACMKEKHAL